MITTHHSRRPAGDLSEVLGAQDDPDPPGGRRALSRGRARSDCGLVCVIPLGRRPGVQGSGGHGISSCSDAFGCSRDGVLFRRSAVSTGCALQRMLRRFMGRARRVLLDTRPGTSTVDGQFAGGGAIAGDEEISIAALGRGGIPTSGVGAVALNVTVSNPLAGGFLTVFPSEASRPNASNLNFVVGQTVANMILVPVGSDGRVALFNGSSAKVDVIVDVLGWFPEWAGVQWVDGGPTARHPPGCSDGRRNVQRHRRGVRTGLVECFNSGAWWCADDRSLCGRSQRDSDRASSCRLCHGVAERNSDATDLESQLPCGSDSREHGDRPDRR